MSYLHIEHDEETRNAAPSGVLRVAAGIAVMTIALAGFARYSQAGTVLRTETSPVVNSRALVFTDLPDGRIGVRDPVRGEVLEPLEGSGGFVRGSLRALARQRRLANVGPEVPFYLARHADGRLTLSDSATNNHLDLQAFGPDNSNAFAGLLPR